jgi:peptidylprolyl isomerase
LQVHTRPWHFNKGKVGGAYLIYLPLPKQASSVPPKIPPGWATISEELFMTTAKSGDSVNVHYTGTLDDGSTFDSSKGRDPLQFTVGSGMVIAGFDEAVTGMAVGDTKSVTFPPEEAYGAILPEMIREVERSNMPDTLELAIGVQLQAGAPGQQPTIVTVVGLTDDTVTLDGNHALAGKALTFELELVSIG